jgi:carbon monoxide dehydrogenase subunit G
MDKEDFARYLTAASSIEKEGQAMASALRLKIS